MRCKLHTTDYTSSIGVCATCLHHRLLPLLAAQAAASEHTRHLQTTAPPPPRSVSPYIPRRKSDTTPKLHHLHNFPGKKFFSTPQIGPNFEIIDDYDEENKKKKRSKFSKFSSFFRFGKIKRVDSVDQSAIKCNMKSNQIDDRVFSSSKYSKNEYSDEHYRFESSKYSSDEHYRVESNKYSSEGWRRTPKSGGRRSDSSRIGFWTSPLASKRREWSREGVVATEVVVSDEVGWPEKLQESNASRFWKKGWRKTELESSQRMVDTN